MFGFLTEDMLWAPAEGPYRQEAKPQKRDLYMTYALAPTIMNSGAWWLHSHTGILLEPNASTGRAKFLPPYKSLQATRADSAKVAHPLTTLSCSGIATFGWVEFSSILEARCCLF